MRMSLHQIKTNVETYYQVTLPNKSRKQHIQIAKQMFSHVAVEQGYSHEQVAQTLQCDRTNIYNNILRLRDQLQYHSPTQTAYNAVINSDMADYIDVPDVKLKSECTFTWEANEIRLELLRLKAKNVNHALKSLQWINEHDKPIPNDLLNDLAHLNQDDIENVRQQIKLMANRTEINGKGTKHFSTFGSNVSDFVF